MSVDGSEAASTSFRLVGETTVHEGHIWHVTVATFRAPDGECFDRDVVRSPGAVGVLPLLFDAEGVPSVVLVDQYRPPLDEIVREIPAGVRDVEGKPLADLARRELIEEAGLEARTIVPLGEIMPSPGMTDSLTWLFLATDCTPVATDRHGPEEQHMSIVHLPLAEAVAMVLAGTIRDAKTVTALLLTERRLSSADGG